MKKKRRRGAYQLDQYIARRNARDEFRRELEAKTNPPRPAPHRPDTLVRVYRVEPRAPWAQKERSTPACPPGVLR